MDIVRVLNRFLEDNGFECEVVMSDEFAYYYAKSEIAVTTNSDERMDRLFREFAIRIGLEVVCDDFLLAFFHELGHNETADDIDDEDMDYSQDMKATLSDSDNDCEIYFNLPDEIEATLWAIDFINNNEEIVKRLQEAIDR